MEEWKRILIKDEITKYEISNLGRCRHTEKLTWKTRGLLKQKVNKKTGYCQYTIVHKGINYYEYVHRLVAKYFVKGDQSLEVNHKDGVKQNNEASNLEWVTKQENMIHCFQNGLSSVSKPIKQFDLKGVLIRGFKSASEAERLLGLKARSISSCLNNEYNTTGGYQWRFAEDTRQVFDIAATAKKHNIGVVQLTLNGKYVDQFEKISDAYKAIGKTDNGVISQVCKGRRKQYFGYRWMYLDDYKEAVDEEIVYSHS
ncbi:NUMOD1 domain-containing DNA-binding protein [Bacillus infantis]|uniref:NUMOD1 domain-containing DNA-binding protein n=1 Tax=Bacillus infantis TaxID=324767 RepID=UPI00209EF45A|nr:NUMOD1 domain-containing DNA-binding protein [Bacillus infantis]MCP1159289.1 HNH endonuclease [Bacillus infantis]